MCTSSATPSKIPYRAACTSRRPARSKYPAIGYPVRANRHDVTLPKGGIALNHAEETVVSGNDLRNNHIGITVVAGSVRIESNTIVPQADGIRMKIWRSANTPPEIQR